MRKTLSVASSCGSSVRASSRWPELQLDLGERHHQSRIGARRLAVEVAAGGFQIAGGDQRPARGCHGRPCRAGSTVWLREGRERFLGLAPSRSGRRGSHGIEPPRVLVAHLGDGLAAAIRASMSAGSSEPRRMTISAVPARSPRPRRFVATALK